MSGQNLRDAVHKRLSQNFAYARIAADLVIQETSDNFNLILQSKPEKIYTGVLLTELFWEFIGAENYLEKIRQDPFRSYKIERINRHNPRNDKTVYLNLQLSPLEEDDFLLLIEDDSEFGQLEQTLVQERNELRLAQQQLATANFRLRQLDHLKSLFFSMAAHDLRSPLMVIHGYADLIHYLVNEDLPNELLLNKIDANSTLAEVNDYLDVIRVQTSWLENIIHNLIDLNCIDGDKLHLDVVERDLNDFVNETVDIMRPMAKLNTLTLVANIPETTNIVSIDPQRVGQILQNLIGNAIKYTPEGGEIHVTVRPDIENGVDVAIIDNGRGMTETQLENVFQLYYRTDDARRSDIRGSGLGLFIVRTLVEAHKGRVDVKSALGEGSAFSFWLPYAAPAKDT